MVNFDIEILPDEVLEFILSLIPPYKDLHECMLVSKRWRRCVLNVVKIKQRNLYKAINDFDVRWERLTPIDMAPTIQKRYSHTAVVHDNSMFIFGGCTCAMTTYNDLWRLDLTKRQWIRPLAMGNYPSPKACSSLIKHGDTLILFGGWAYPPSYPLYQSWHLFNELHVYDIVGNRWSAITTLNTPPPVAGHSVSIVGEWMIVFGGLQKPCNAVHCEKSKDIWKLNLRTWSWHKQKVEGVKPKGRFGQTQVVLDKENLLILGGSGGPTSHYCDCWLLNMSGEVWTWKEVEIQGKTNEPSNIWSNPGCKIGDKIVVLNRIREQEPCSIAYYPKNTWNINDRSAAPEDGRLARIDLASRQTDKDDNVNGKRGTLRTHKREAEEDVEGTSKEPVKIHYSLPGTSGISMAAFNIQENRRLHDSDRIREKRLANLLKVEETLTKGAFKREKKTHYLGIYVLDISRVLEGGHVAVWLPPKNLKNGPEETILYTLVEGKSELIMFGGIQKDANSLGYSKNLSSQISNSLHFITAPSYVI